MEGLPGVPDGLQPVTVLRRGLAVVVLSCAVMQGTAAAGAAEPAHGDLPSPTVADLVALLDAAASPNLTVAVPAQERLAALGPDAISKLSIAGSRNSFDHPTRPVEAARAVVRMGPAALPTVVRMFGSSPDGDEGVLAADVLGLMGEPAFEPLSRLLGHADPRVRERAAKLLANRADPRTADALASALGSDDVSVRAAAARGLSVMGDRRHTQRFLEMLRAQEWVERQAGAAALGRIFESRFIPPLAARARWDSEIQVRSTASNVLAYSRDVVAERLGHRYAPLGLSPVLEPRAMFVLGCRLLVTGGLLVAASVWPVLGAADRLRRGRFAVPLVVALTAGVVWGRVLEQLTGRAELVVLLGVVPAPGMMGGLIGVLRGRQAAKLNIAATLGGFYAGFAAGWIALWHLRLI